MTLRLPAIFSDHMVIQHNRPVKVWGWAQAGQSVKAELGGNAATGQSDAQGKWQVTLPGLSAGGPFTLAVSTGQETLVRRDILAGEVWVCSGQSNMEWPMCNVNNAEAEQAAADHPIIRLFTVQKDDAKTPREDCMGQWQVCSPKTIGTFSAVGYFFGRRLHKTLGVPVGLINTSWGGTTAEAWTSLEALKSDTEIAHLAAVAETAAPIVPHEDPGNKGFKKGWAKPELKLRGWKDMNLPTFWQSQGLVMNGAVWFRKEVDVPAAWAGRDLTLCLGAVDDCDTTYFNGEPVGATGLETPNCWVAPREYPIPGKLVQAGRNVIAVRVFDRWGNGGFVGRPDGMKLACAADGQAPVPVGGAWKYKVELELEQRNPGGGGVAATTLFNGMIQPLLPYGIRGAIWYQGESNAGRAYQYRKVFATMIRDWRNRWEVGAFPFLFVQLANYQPRSDVPVESDWAELREAQTMALNLPNTGMAVTIDIGEGADIHPRNKQDVGLRLALAAEHTVYGLKNVVPSGPLYREMKAEGGSIRLSFQHAEGGLVAKDGALVGFAIAGADRQFVWGEAKIEGQDVVVSVPLVKKPVAVRYGWAANPACNLYNAAGLPASPFRTDDWPGITVNAR